MEKKNIFCFMNEDGDVVVIVGTHDPVVAEKCLRDTEVEWYGKDHEETPIDFDLFSALTLYEGVKKGEEGYYWGENPKEYFDGGEYEETIGFLANVG